METFEKIPIGIHGKELPKFSKRPSTQQYWRISNDSYVDKPLFQSREEMLHFRIPWARNDSKNEFNAVYVSQKKNKEVTEKINNVSAFINEPEELFKSTKKKWSEGMYHFMPRNKVREDSVTKKDSELTLSSFGASKKFIEPSVKPKKMYY